MFPFNNEKRQECKAAPLITKPTSANLGRSTSNCALSCSMVASGPKRSAFGSAAEAGRDALGYYRERRDESRNVGLGRT